MRRAEILQAAETIFVRDGYQGATIRKIAEEVGVSSTALYMHFRDKDEILLEICENAAEALLTYNIEVANRPIDATTRVRLILAAYMRFGLKNPNAFQLAFGLGADQLSQNRVRSAMGQRCYDQFREVFADAVSQRQLRLGSNQVATHILWSACHGLVALRVSRPDEDWADNETLIEGMLDTLFDGLLKA